MDVKDITPAQWLLVDAASQFGLDKEHFEERIEFGREILPYIKECKSFEQLPEKLGLYFDEADEPEMFAASCLAIWDVVNGKPSGYMVGLDAASSGPQILSCLCKCIVGMTNTGAIYDGNVPDLYTLIKNNMGFDAPRKDVKKATVPYVYGSKVAPVNVFGNEYMAFIKAYQAVVPWAEWAKNVLIGCWNEAALFNEWETPDGGVAHVKIIGKCQAKGNFLGREYTFIFDANRTKEKGEQGTRSIGANVTHSYDGYILRELHRRCNYNARRVNRAIKLIRKQLAGELNREPIPNKKTGKALRLQKLATRFNNFSVRVIDYLDEVSITFLSENYLMRILVLLEDMVAHESFYVRTIHDEFACLPNHVYRMKQVYNALLAEAYESTWLFDVLEDLSGKSFHDLMPEVEEGVADEIRENWYAIN